MGTLRFVGHNWTYNNDYRLSTFRKLGEIVKQRPFEFSSVQITLKKLMEADEYIDITSKSTDIQAAKYELINKLWDLGWSRTTMVGIFVQDEKVVAVMKGRDYYSSLPEFE